MAFKLVKKNLAGYVADAIAAYKSSGEKMHIAVMSALHNLCTSGDNTLLNRVYDNLRTNDQQALKLYIRRAGIVNGLVMTNGPANVEALPTETMQEMLKIGSIVDFKKGKFSVLQGPGTDAAKSLAVLVETRFLNPDGEADKMVFERNNFAEHKTLGDAEVLKALLKTTNEALANNADNKTYALSSAIKARLEKIKAMLDTNVGQATLDKG